MKKIPLIFIGTGDIGVPLLEALASDERFDLKLVITQADKPAGRKMELKPSPIKVKSEELRVESFQPDNINSEDSLEKIRQTNVEMIVLMAYGQILKSDLLRIPKYGCINVHASLLPKYRGASPIQQSLLEQDEKTGISIMQMIEKMDAGMILASFDIPIPADENAISLSGRLANFTAYNTPNVLYNITIDEFDLVAQDESRVTYCQKIKKSDGEINWNEDGKTITAKIRAYAGWPGTHTFWNNRRLKILNGQYDEFAGKPGQVFEKDHLIMVGTGKGSIILDQVQMEGKNTQSISQFTKGYPDFVGSNLGN